MAGIASDLRLAIRMIIRRPGFSALVMLTLAVGIGATTAMFSVVDGVLIRDLPYPDADRLIRIRTQFQGRIQSSSSAANFLDYREQIESLQSVTVFRYRRRHLGESPEPRFLLGAGVSHEFFEVLGVPPLLGRSFSVDDERPDAEAVVISHGLWQSHFGGRDDVVGSGLMLDSTPLTVVGVAPAGFAYPHAEVEVWRPLWFDPSATGLRTDHIYEAVARVAADSSPEAATEELRAYGERMVLEYPQNYKNFDYGVSAVSLHEWAVGESRTPLLVLLAAVIFVLLIAVANVSNLLLASSETRHHEIALRAALGGSRSRIARQLLAECLVLSAGGGIAGLLVAIAGLRALLSLAEDAVPRIEAVTFDLRLLVFTALVSIAAGLLAGVVPAFRISTRLPRQALQLGSHTVAAGRTGLMRSALVIAEVALAVVLVIGAGLMLRTLGELGGVDFGFRIDDILTARISLPVAEYTEGPRVAEYYRDLQTRIEALPGVVSAGIVWHLPLASGFGTYSIQIEGREVETIGESPHTLLQLTSPGYFETMGIAALRGRLHDQRDTPGRPLAVLANQAFTRQLLAGDTGVGSRLRLWGDDTPWFEIVGVVPDVLQEGVARDARPTLYLNHAQIGIEGVPPDFFLLEAARGMALVVRAEREASALAAPVREAARTIDPSVPIRGFRTMDEVRASAAADREFPTVLLVVFGCIALTLSILGVYGVVTYGVNRRTREIGIRMALGGDAAGVRRMVVRNGLKPVLLGLVLGLAGAAATSQAMVSLLYGVAPTDPNTLVAVSIIIAAAALVANYVPALRASRVDPAQVLRSE